MCLVGPEGRESKACALHLPEKGSSSYDLSPYSKIASNTVTRADDPQFEEGEQFA